MVTLKKREYEIKSANNEKSCFVYDSQYKTINNALQKIRDEIPEAISCVLYGSCSRNESKYESDVDLTADQQEVPDLYIGGGMNCEKDPQMFNSNCTLKSAKNTYNNVDCNCGLWYNSVVTKLLLRDVSIYGNQQSFSI